MKQAIREMLSLLLVVLIGAGPAAAEEPDEAQKKMMKSLGAFGLALGGLTVTVAKESSTKPSITAPASQQALQRMVDGYKFSRDAGRGTVAVLDTTFEIALTGIDVTTGGSSLLATTGVRWAKRQALDGLTDKIVSDARSAMAGGIHQFVQSEGLDYEGLRTKTPAEIKTALNRVPVFQEMKASLAGDAAAQDVLERTAVDVIVSTNKATLDQLAQTQQEVEATKAKVTGLAHSITQYMDHTNKRLVTFTNALNETNAAVQKANDAIQALQDQTANNTQQLQMIGGFMFGRATAQERLLMLQSGFMKDELTDKQFESLLSATQSDAKRERLVQDMSNVVQQFNKIGKIAQDLHIDIPGLSETLTIANAANTVISDVMSGDFLVSCFRSS